MFQVAGFVSTAHNRGTGGCVQMPETEIESGTHIGMGAADHPPWLLLSEAPHLATQACTTAAPAAAVTIQGC